MTDQHSPLPWTRDMRVPACVRDADGDLMIDLDLHALSHERAVVDAALIVRAVNAHVGLVNALRWALLNLGCGANPHLFDLATAALEKAEEP